MLKRVNKEQICCPVVFFEEIWGGKYPAGPRASCLRIGFKFEIVFARHLLKELTVGIFSKQYGTIVFHFVFP